MVAFGPFEVLGSVTMVSPVQVARGIHNQSLLYFASPKSTYSWSCPLSRCCSFTTLQLDCSCCALHRLIALSSPVSSLFDSRDRRVGYSETRPARFLFSILYSLHSLPNRQTYLKPYAPYIPQLARATKRRNTLCRSLLHFQTGTRLSTS